MTTPKPKLFSLAGLLTGLMLGASISLFTGNPTPTVALALLGFLAPILSWRGVPPAHIKQKDTP